MFINKKRFFALLTSDFNSDDINNWNKIKHMKEKIIPDGDLMRKQNLIEGIN